MWNTNKYRIKIIIFYYITIKTYVLACINIYLIIYFLCIIIMAQLFKNNFSIFFRSLFYNILYFYNNYSYQMKVYNLKHSFVYKQKENKQKNY